MSTVSLACNALMIGCGVQYVRLRSNLDRLFAIVAAFVVAYVAAVFIAARLPWIGPAVSANAGVANGGLTPQVILLFPVWAPFLAKWAGRRLREPEAATV
jgi:hypothetical protein